VKQNVRNVKLTARIQIVLTVIYSPIKVLDLQCTDSEFRMADLAQDEYCFLCLSVRCKTSLAEALGEGYIPHHFAKKYGCHNMSKFA